MSTVNFKIPLNVEVTDQLTGLIGITASAVQLINGCIKYGVQPKCTPASNIIPDSWDIDEQQLVCTEPQKQVDWSYTFVYETGDYVEDIVTGFEGYITMRILDLNKCERYIITGKPDKKGNTKRYVFKQEIMLLHKGLNKTGSDFKRGKKLGKRENTGCASTKSWRV